MEKVLFKFLLKVQNAIASSDSKHFLVLFRDHRLQYRGLYTWDQFSEAVHKIGKI